MPYGRHNALYYKGSQGSTTSQLTAKGGTMVVDFYPVKFATGEIHNRLMLKIVNFGGDQQSKTYQQERHAT